MKVFIDTSSLIKNYIEENGTEEVSEIFQKSSHILLSPITKIEFVSALQRLVNTNFLAKDSFDLAMNEFLSDSNDFEYQTFDKKTEMLSIDLLQKYRIRTLDAIQLASSLALDIDLFVTSDKRLFEATEQEFPKNKVLFI